MSGNPVLLTAGVLNAAAALLHLGCILGGPAWYRFFGAGEGMARAAARGDPKAALITLAIAAVLAIWAAYAFSGAGVIARLPLLKLGLAAISVVYLLRAIGYIPALYATGAPVGTFAWVSSAIVAVYAAVHIIGTAQLWRA